MDQIKDYSEIQGEDEEYICCVDEVGDMVKHMVRLFQLIERDQIKPLGFTSSQCYSLMELLEHGDMTMQELSERMNLNSSTMTRVVDKLVRDKYINRSRSENDRRLVIVSLSEKGINSAKTVETAIKSYYKDVTRNLPKDRIEEVLEAVALLMKAFDKSNPNCC